MLMIFHGKYKKFCFSAIVMLIISITVIGCTSQRKLLIKRFQTVYPETWQRKLLEYDIESQRLQNLWWQGYWQVVASAPRISAPMANPQPQNPIIYMSPPRQNANQEALAGMRLQEYWRNKLNLP